MTHERTNVSSPLGEPEPPTGCLVRVLWMVIGQGALAILAFTLLRQSPWSFSVRDVAFWLIVGLVIAARYVDVTRFDGRTANGEPATLRDFRRHTIGLVLVCGAVWTFAHSVSW